MPRDTILTFLLLAASAVWLRAEEASALWANKIQPLFDVQCSKCHGPIQQKSGLELDTPEAVLKGGDEGPAVVPGKPEESRLYQYLAPDSDPHMPPKKQLSEAERALVRDWIVALGQEGAPKPEPVAETAQGFDEPHRAIDHYLAKGWVERKLSPAKEIDEHAWCRRLFLDLAGRVPTRSELDDFLFSPAPDKRRDLVERLLVSPEHAARLRELWDVWLMGRGKRERSEDRRRDNGWWKFLEQSFLANRPWNEIVHDILAARPAKEEYRGATWFLYERRNEYQAIAEAVAPVVYGTKIDCAQCHDHPLAREIKQAHYWGLVAAFNRGKNVDSNSVGESAIGGFVNFTNLKKESQPAVLTLLSGPKIEETRPAPDEKEKDSDDLYLDPKAKVKVPKFSRREAFAKASTEDNPLLARAFVNRMWAALMGRGIVHPADEMTTRNAPSHPELLDWLANDFATRNYDIRRLIRGIVLSRAYALGFQPGTPPDSFAASPERPLTAEQISRSWRVAAGMSPEDDTLRRALIVAIPEVLPKEYNASFQQAQFMTNSPALTAILRPSAGNTVERLAAIAEPANRAREAFLAVLGRLPDAEEAERACAFLPERPDNPTESTRGLLWALMTSAEFLTMP